MTSSKSKFTDGAHVARLSGAECSLTPFSISCAPSRRSIADIFRIQVVSNPDVRSPIITLGSTSFFHVRHDNLYVVAVTK